MPSASSALKPAATTACRPFTERHLPRARKSAASTAMKKYWALMAKNRSGSSRPSCPTASPFSALKIVKSM